MKINGVDIRVGNLLEVSGRLWVVLKTMHTQPGKGGAFMQVEMKDIRSGTKDNVRFRSSEAVERVQLEEEEYQYLYDEGDTVAVMNKASYEQRSLDKKLIGEKIPFLKEGMDVALQMYKDEPVSMLFPDTMEFQVMDCEPVVKGQTATSSYKPALLDNGVKVGVPPFINVGDRIVVKLDPLQYIERAK